MFDRDVFACARANFIYAQLQLATTYCLLAEESDLPLLPNRLKNARKTYENVIRFMLRAGLRGDELSDITSNAEGLKFRLEALEAQCFQPGRCVQHGARIGSPSPSHRESPYRMPA